MFVPSLLLRFKILDILVLFLIYIIIFYLHIMFKFYWNKTFESLANNFHSAYIRFCIILLCYHCNGYSYCFVIMILVQPFVQVGLQAESQAVRSLSCKTVCGYALYM
ncbi:hypothetical protein V8G54_024680, partial [Vigna mungo]